MAAPWRAMLRHGRFFSGHRARQTVRPKDGRDRARPSNEDLHGGPWSLMAAGGGSGIPWRAMLRHGRLFPGHRARQTVRPKDGRDRVRPSNEDPHGGPWSLMAGPWRAMLCHGRGGIRYPMEGHAPSWPQGDDAVVGRSQRRTRQSASLQGRSPWRAMLCHGRWG